MTLRPPGKMPLGTIVSPLGRDPTVLQRLPVAPAAITVQRVGPSSDSGQGGYPND